MLLRAAPTTILPTLVVSSLRASSFFRNYGVQNFGTPSRRVRVKFLFWKIAGFKSFYIFSTDLDSYIRLMLYRVQLDVVLRNEHRDSGFRW